MQLNRIFLFFFALLLLLSVLSGCSVATAADPTDDRAVSGDESNFLDTLTFLGDSTTAHMQQRSPIAAERIWATPERYLNLDARITYAKIIAPDNGKPETIKAVAARLKPKRLVITLGIDYGVYYYRDRPDTFRLYYEKLLSAIAEASPETELILQSVFPVGRECKTITNQMVASANGIIQEIAASRGLSFVDQTAVLADSEGFLKQEYCYSSDGLHLTENAYSAILAHLSSFSDEIGGKA